MPPFTEDFADILWSKCFAANTGFNHLERFEMAWWNTDEFYRVIITTKLCQTELEFNKLIGTTRIWRQGVELGTEN